MSDGFTRLCTSLGYRFTDDELLRRALTHRSLGPGNYERLEFLGDSVLGAIIAEAVYARFPELSEGDLTRLRARLVCEPTLAGLARGLNLGALLRLGEGELKSGGYDRDSILADSLEAIIGAVFRDGGYSAAQAVILRLYAGLLTDIGPVAALKDPKTRLQEWLQGRGHPVPVYQTREVAEEGGNPQFVAECRVTGLDTAIQGVGATRRQAEQEAAAGACELLGA